MHNILTHHLKYCPLIPYRVTVTTQCHRNC